MEINEHDNVTEVKGPTASGKTQYVLKYIIDNHHMFSEIHISGPVAAKEYECVKDIFEREVYFYNSPEEIDVEQIDSKPKLIIYDDVYYNKYDPNTCFFSKLRNATIKEDKLFVIVCY